MSKLEFPERKRLNRVDAADFITRRHFGCTVSSLEKHATKGTGPDYLCAGPNGGGEAFYLPADLDTWADSWLKRPKTRQAKPQIAVLA